MTTAIELLQQGRREEVWKKYCGFLDLNVQEYMDIQERLLMEQINLLSRCELGQKLLGDQVPTSIEQFRSQVPLTTYYDYLPFLEDRNPAPLPRPPAIWARTSGRSSEFGGKWVPYSKEMTRKIGEFAMASFLLASCQGRGDVQLNVGDYCLYTLAPAPYFTGSAVARGLLEHLDPTFIPSLDEGDKMDFEQRIEEGFRLALKHRLDLFYGLSSILVAIGERFANGLGGGKFSMDMLHPRLISRVLRGMLVSKLQKRNLLPKDLWKVKGIVAGGMDTAFYRDAIEALWGKKPLEGYGGTELGGIALQAWNYKGMTFLPDCNFLEFIPGKDYFSNPENQGESNKHLNTLLLDELTPGIYELVITNFHGCVFTRYRTGDLIQIVGLRDEELNINTPQMVFYARADGVIDLGGFTRLTEKSIWMAIVDANISTNGWTAHKEYINDKPVLHLYLEPKGHLEKNETLQAIHQRLKEKDPGYAEMEDMLGFNPLVISILPEGAFTRYTETKRASGAEMAHLKAPRVNPSQQVLDLLMRS